MGLSDRKVKEKIVDAKHVCDLINGGFFQGEQVLKAAKMKKVSEVVGCVFTDGNGREKKVERILDGLFQYDEREFFIFFSLQNQHDISYIMPVREMLGSSLIYSQQITDRSKELKALHLHQEGGEFLSGFLKTDRLMPVCGIVFYYGEEPWDGAVSLHEMLEFPAGLEGLKELCPDYKINLIDYSHVHPENFRTGLRQLFELLPYAGDKKLMCEYVKVNRERYENLDKDCWELLEAFLGIQFSDELRKEKCRNINGGYDMCTALEGLFLDGKEEGKAEGKAEAIILLLSNIAPVTEALSERIKGEQDVEKLHQWLLLAAKAENVEIFEAAM